MEFIPYKRKACSNCPFRKDCPPGWLGAERMEEILESDSFVCHKTTEEGKTRLQCAGFMIIQKDDSAFVRIAKATRTNLELTGKELIFGTREECI